MFDYLLLLVGVLCAGAGGELFVRGVVGLARWTRVPAGLIAATVAAFATSSPELAVAISAALAGTPHLSFGDALGSNVTNVGLILGLALVIAPIYAPRDSLRRDFPVALLAPLITSLILLDGWLSFVDGALLLGIFLAWLGAVTLEARKQRAVAGELLGQERGGLVILQSVIGLLLLVAAGRFIVVSATSIAYTMGLSTFVIGATVVAVATSVPELATTLIARLRGHAEIGLGAILGSNIYNSLFITSVVTLLHPFQIGLREVALGLTAGVLSIVIVYPRRSGLIDRWRGFVLLGLFATYMVAVLTVR